MDAIITRSNLRGEIAVCGSRGHTMRALCIAALTEGTSIIHNPLVSPDVEQAVAAMAALGAGIRCGHGKWVVGGGNLHVPNNYIDVGNSATTLYFLMSIASLLDGYTFITGSEKIRRLPVEELMGVLQSLGAKAFPTQPGSECAPLVIGGKRGGGAVRFTGFNSRFISGLMMASPLLETDTEIFVDLPREKPYLQMTIDSMRRFGAEVENIGGKYEHFLIRGRQKYMPCDWTVPADWSAVVFPLVAAVITQSEVTITGVDFGDTQGDKAVVEHLLRMGADITCDVEAGTLTVVGGKPLKGGGTINMTDIPETFPALAVAAAYAEGETVFTGLAHTRKRTCDRAAAMEAYLKAMGADVETTTETMTVRGAKKLRGVVVDCHTDPKLAMAMTVAGLGADGAMIVRDAECAEASFPQFFERMQDLGACI